MKAIIETERIFRGVSISYRQLLAKKEPAPFPNAGSLREDHIYPEYDVVSRTHRYRKGLMRGGSSFHRCHLQFAHASGFPRKDEFDQRQDNRCPQKRLPKFDAVSRLLDRFHELPVARLKSNDGWLWVCHSRRKIALHLTLACRAKIGFIALDIHRERRNLIASFGVAEDRVIPRDPCLIHLELRRAIGSDANTLHGARSRHRGRCVRRSDEHRRARLHSRQGGQPQLEWLGRYKGVWLVLIERGVYRTGERRSPSNQRKENTLAREIAVGQRRRSSVEKNVALCQPRLNKKWRSV